MTCRACRQLRGWLTPRPWRPVLLVLLWCHSQKRRVEAEEAQLAELGDTVMLSPRRLSAFTRRVEADLRRRSDKIQQLMDAADPSKSVRSGSRRGRRRSAAKAAQALARLATPTRQPTHLVGAASKATPPRAHTPGRNGPGRNGRPLSAVVARRQPGPGPGAAAEPPRHSFAGQARQWAASNRQRARPASAGTTVSFAPGTKPAAEAKMLRRWETHARWEAAEQVLKAEAAQSAGPETETGDDAARRASGRGGGASRHAVRVVELQAAMVQQAERAGARRREAAAARERMAAGWRCGGRCVLFGGRFD
jgi:hypothetical protein|eukprot:COSAG01_NODE_1866_length_9033_cov_5.018359_8_plen_308_part_00